MQIHSTAFRQENLAMKKRENMKSIILQLWQTAKPLLPKRHISQTSDQSEPSNFPLYVIKNILKLAK